MVCLGALLVFPDLFGCNFIISLLFLDRLRSPTLLKLQLRFILPSNPPSSRCEKQHGARHVSAGAQRQLAGREAVAVPLILLVLTFLCSEPKAVKKGMLARSWLHGNVFGASAQRSGLEKAAI